MENVSSSTRLTRLWIIVEGKKLILDPTIRLDHVSFNPNPGAVAGVYLHGFLCSRT